MSQNARKKYQNIKVVCTSNKETTTATKVSRFRRNTCITYCISPTCLLETNMLQRLDSLKSNPVLSRALAPSQLSHSHPLQTTTISHNHYLTLFKIPFDQLAATKINLLLKRLQHHFLSRLANIGPTLQAPSRVLWRRTI